MPLSKEAVIAFVQDERRRQDEKWGPQSEHTFEHWLAILTEEVGEVAKAILETDVAGPRYEIRNELIHVAAVAMAALEFGEKIR
jgi:NTP pyrophosphatase (non-canonical NTP hydrolase)